MTVKWPKILLPRLLTASVCSNPAFQKLGRSRLLSTSANSLGRLQQVHHGIVSAVLHHATYSENTFSGFAVSASIPHGCTLGVTGEQCKPSNHALRSAAASAQHPPLSSSPPETWNLSQQALPWPIFLFALRAAASIELPPSP